MAAGVLGMDAPPANNAMFTDPGDILTCGSLTMARMRTGVAAGDVIEPLYDGEIFINSEFAARSTCFGTSNIPTPASPDLTNTTLSRMYCEVNYSAQINAPPSTNHIDPACNVTDAS